MLPGLTQIGLSADPPQTAPEPGFADLIDSLLSAMAGVNETLVTDGLADGSVADRPPVLHAARGGPSKFSAFLPASPALMLRAGAASPASGGEDTAAASVPEWPGQRRSAVAQPPASGWEDTAAASVDDWLGQALSAGAPSPAFGVEGTAPASALERLGQLRSTAVQRSPAERAEWQPGEAAPGDTPSGAGEPIAEPEPLTVVVAPILTCEIPQISPSPNAEDPKQEVTPPARQAGLTGKTREPSDHAGGEITSPALQPGIPPIPQLPPPRMARAPEESWPVTPPVAAPSPLEASVKPQFKSASITRSDEVLFQGAWPDTAARADARTAGVRPDRTLEAPGLTPAGPDAASSPDGETPSTVPAGQESATAPPSKHAPDSERLRAFAGWMKPELPAASPREPMTPRPRLESGVEESRLDDRPAVPEAGSGARNPPGEDDGRAKGNARRPAEAGELPVRGPGHEPAPEASQAPPRLVESRGSPFGVSGEASGAGEPPRQGVAPVRAVAEPAGSAPTSQASFVRQLRIEVPDGGQGVVGLQIRERQGAIQFEVKASNPRVVELLRQELPELSSQLKDNGWQSASWGLANPSKESGPSAREPASPPAVFDNQMADPRNRQQNPRSHARRYRHSAKVMATAQEASQ